MYKIKVLGSSSTDGNATLFYKDNGRITMVDWGCEVSEEDLKLIDEVYITHYHGDHTWFLNQLNKYPNIKLINTSEYLVDHCKGHNLHKLISNFAFSIKIDDIKIFFMTDCGNVDKEWMKTLDLSEYEILCIECNYNAISVANIKFEDIKSIRQFSRVGHLSNLQALDFILKTKFNLSKNGRILFLHKSYQYADKNTWTVFESLKQPYIIAEKGQIIYCKNTLWKLI